MNGINSNSNNIFDQLEDIQERVERHRVEVEALNGRVTILEESFGILSQNPTFFQEPFTLTERSSNAPIQRNQFMLRGIIGGLVGAIAGLAIGIIFGQLGALLGAVCGAICGAGVGLASVFCKKKITVLSEPNFIKIPQTQPEPVEIPAQPKPEELPPIPEQYRNPQQVPVNFSELTDEQKIANLTERLNEMLEISIRTEKSINIGKSKFIEVAEPPLVAQPAENIERVDIAPVVNFSELTDEQKNANLTERLNDMLEVCKRIENL